MFNTKKISISILACMIGLAVLAPNMTAEATQKVLKNNNDKVVVEHKLSLKERINAILNPEPEPEPEQETFKIPVRVEDDLVSYIENASAIQGAPMASRAQCVRYLLSNNPNPNITVTPEQLVSYYYEEGKLEGIRPDVAFAQALKETGFFKYGGTVIPAQNNYCGLGTTSATVQGAYFQTAQIGVRAHIQHLKAYTSLQQPKSDIVDPRYYLVRNSYGSRTLTNWEDLNGRWAVPGNGYGQSILSIHQSIMKS